MFSQCERSCPSTFLFTFFLKAVYFLDTMKTSTLPKVVNALEQDNDHFEMKQLAPMTDALKIISVSNKSLIIVVLKKRRNFSFTDE